jgi:hypothetical protein
MSECGVCAGWLGDALDASEQALYNFDMAAVHEAYLQTIEGRPRALQPCRSEH